MAATGLSRLCHERLCRSCGAGMISSEFCLYCSEPVAWRCAECGNIADLTHAHVIPTKRVQAPLAQRMVKGKKKIPK